MVDSTINDPNVKGISNCITARYDAGIQKQRSVGTAVIEPKIKRLGNLYDENAGGARAGNVYAPDGLAPALQTAQGGNRQSLIFSNDPVICRSVGRDPDNPSNRKKGCNTEQTLELNMDGMSNTLTTVQKDNYVVEPINYESDGTARTIKSQYYKTSTANFERTGTHGATGVLDITNYRIRKLTPRECFRLMGFSDEDFDKIKGISNTQLYKMAGNSIVVNVLEGIFRELFKAQSR